MLLQLFLQSIAALLDCLLREVCIGRAAPRNKVLCCILPYRMKGLPEDATAKATCPGWPRAT